MKPYYSLKLALLAASIFIPLGNVETRAAAPATPAADSNEVIAEVNGSTITAADINAILKAYPDAERQQITKSKEALRAIVQNEISQRAILAEAREKKWDQRPEVIAQIERAKDAAIVQSFLLTIAEPPKTYPSDPEVQQFYDGNKDKLLVPKQYKLSEIYIAVPPGADKTVQAAAEQKAGEILKKLRAKSDSFENLAKSSSDDKETASRGGDAGLQAETNLRPEITKAVAPLNKGDVSELIKTETGIYIMRLDDVQAARLRPLAEIRPQIVQQMRQLKTRESEETYAKALVEKNAAINEIALDKMMGTQK